jgi:hypothetical protein
MHHATDVVLGPGEDSSIGNVTGGRKSARYVFALTRDQFRQLRDGGCNPPGFVNSERVPSD